MSICHPRPPPLNSPQTHGSSSRRDFCAKVLSNGRWHHLFQWPSLSKLNLRLFLATRVRPRRFSFLRGHLWQAGLPPPAPTRSAAHLNSAPLTASTSAPLTTLH